MYLIHSELEREGNTDIARLRFHCVPRKEVFISARTYIHKLAELEKKRVELETEFNKILSTWNKKEETMNSPYFDNGQ